MWSPVNRALNTFFDFVLWPFQGLPVLWQVFALALPATVVGLLAFRYVSDQRGIIAVKDKIKAHLLELRLFKDDLSVMLAAQGRILRYTLTYMRYGLMPMAVMIVPFLLILIQVESRYAFRPLHPGESTILTVTVDSDTPVSELSTTLTLPVGLTQETPALRIDSSREIYWRLRAERAGEYPIEVTVGDQTVVKRIAVGEASGKISPAVYRANDIRTLAYPMEPPLGSNAIASEVEITYARDRAAFAGLSSASWALFGMCMVLGFLLRSLFRVTF